MDAKKVEYFEMDLMPGRKFFRCEPLRASISVDECARRWRAGNMAAAQTVENPMRFGDGPDSEPSANDARMRCLACRACPLGGEHAGVRDANPSMLKGQTVCARCHRGATRLIFKSLCTSCYNRQREYLIGKNGKGTAPVKLAPLSRRTVSYVAGGQLKTKAIERSLDVDELVVAVLRDEPHAIRFIPTVPAELMALRALEGV